jgi:exodeoxyribonuclease VII large subunit
LQRGYAVVRDNDGQPLHAAAAVKTGAALDIEFADGHVKVREESEPKQGRLL